MNSKSKIGIGVVAVIIGLIVISGVSGPSFSGVSGLPSHAIVDNAPGSVHPGCEPNCFIPSKVTISSGGQVTFVNNDNTEHTATNGTPAEGPYCNFYNFHIPIGCDGGLDGFDTGLMQIGDSYTTPKLSSGEYPYFCMVHPWMAGVIIVK